MALRFGGRLWTAEYVETLGNRFGGRRWMLGRVENLRGSRDVAE